MPYNFDTRSRPGFTVSILGLMHRISLLIEESFYIVLALEPYIPTITLGQLHHMLEKDRLVYLRTTGVHNGIGQKDVNVLPEYVVSAKRVRHCDENMWTSWSLETQWMKTFKDTNPRLTRCSMPDVFQLLFTMECNRHLLLWSSLESPESLRSLFCFIFRGCMQPQKNITRLLEWPLSYLLCVCSGSWRGLRLYMTCITSNYDDNMILLRNNLIINYAPIVPKAQAPTFPTSDAEWETKSRDSRAIAGQKTVSHFTFTWDRSTPT